MFFTNPFKSMGQDILMKKKKCGKKKDVFLFGVNPKAKIEEKKMTKY